jgi:hypothetical protein
LNQKNLVKGKRSGEVVLRGRIGGVHKCDDDWGNSAGYGKYAKRGERYTKEERQQEGRKG